mgnify:CR=1 FL=1
MQRKQNCKYSIMRPVTVKLRDDNALKIVENFKYLGA